MLPHDTPNSTILAAPRPAPSGRGPPRQPARIHSRVHIRNTTRRGAQALSALARLWPRWKVARASENSSTWHLEGGSRGQHHVPRVDGCPAKGVRYERDLEGLTHPSTKTLLQPQDGSRSKGSKIGGPGRPQGPTGPTGPAHWRARRARGLPRSGPHGPHGPHTQPYRACVETSTG